MKSDARSFGSADRDVRKIVLRSRTANERSPTRWTRNFLA